MRRALILALGLIVALGIGAAAPAYADVAPPQNPPGASIKNGQDTKVQMVSENVLMTITDYKPTDEQKQSYAAPFMRGHVDATFVMQNQGDSAESFDVWFPIGTDTGMGKVATVDNFTAYVDGAQAASIGEQMTQGQYDQQVPWATWPASFPPGQQVTLRVTYDTYPTGYAPYGRFEYILETGAGWNGPIGEGTITYRLPYEASELNAAFNDRSEYYGPHGGPPTVSGTDLVWHFTNLEPTDANNIALTVLDPSVWTGIQRAQADVATSPNSAQAQLELGNALYKGLQWKYGLVAIGESLQLRDMAVAAYEKALALDPNNVDIYSGYLPLLESENTMFEMPNPRYGQLLDRALQLDPGNEQFLTMKENQTFGLTQLATMGTIVPPAPTLTPAPQVTPIPASVAELATPTALPPAGTPDLPTPISTPALPQPDAARTGTLIVVVVVLAAVLLAAALGVGIWLGRRSKGH